MLATTTTTNDTTTTTNVVIDCLLIDPTNRLSLDRPDKINRELLR